MLKIQIITIEGDREEVTGLLHDFDPEEFRVKLVDKLMKEVSLTPQEVFDKIRPEPGIKKAVRARKATKKERKGERISDIPLKELSARLKKLKEHGLKGIRPKVAAVKKCISCGNDFTPNSNRQTKCSSKCGKVTTLKPEKESELIPVPEPARSPEEITENQPEVVSIVKAPEKKIKSCSNCGVSFEDTSSNGNRKKCDKCRFAIKTPKEKKAPGIEAKKTLPVFSKVEIEPELEKRLHQSAEKEAVRKPKINLKEKIDLSENGPLLKPPANNRPPVILKQNERRCKNPKCKKIFVPVNILKDETCPECQERAKQVEAEGEW